MLYGEWYCYKFCSQKVPWGVVPVPVPTCKLDLWPLGDQCFQDYSVLCDSSMLWVSSQTKRNQLSQWWEVHNWILALSYIHVYVTLLNAPRTRIKIQDINQTKLWLLFSSSAPNMPSTQRWKFMWHHTTNTFLLS